VKPPTNFDARLTRLQRAYWFVVLFLVLVVLTAYVFQLVNPRKVAPSISEPPVYSQRL
jgi:hypothetical protein